MDADYFRSMAFVCKHLVLVKLAGDDLVPQQSVSVDGHESSFGGCMYSTMLLISLMVGLGNENRISLLCASMASRVVLEE